MISRISKDGRRSKVFNLKFKFLFSMGIRFYLPIRQAGSNIKVRAHIPLLWAADAEFIKQSLQTCQLLKV